MNKKLNIEEITKRFEDAGLTLLKKEERKLQEKYECYDSDGYLYYLSYNQLKNRNIRFNQKFNPYAIDNVKKYIQLNCNDIELLSDEIFNKETKLKFKCKCSNVFERTWENFYLNKKYYCENCLRTLSGKKYSFDYVKQIVEEHGLKLMTDKYLGNNQNLTCMTKDGYKIHVKFGYLKNGVYEQKKPYIFSPVFNGENYVYNINNYFKLNDIDCKAIDYYYDDDKYSDSVYTVKCKCSCGNIFETTFASIKVGQYRCTKCTSYYSRIELKVGKWLDKKHIEYRRQKTFDDCINPKTKRKLFFDYYLPKYNVCIEVDGAQHYKPVKFCNNENYDEDEYFKSLQERDRIKTEYCKNHNIKLIRIKQNEVERRHEEYKKILYDNLIKK